MEKNQSNNQEKSKIEKIIGEHATSLENVSGGPLKVLNETHLEDLDLGFKALKEDLLVHIKYFPKEDRYGFTIYKQRSGEGGGTGTGY